MELLSPALLEVVGALPIVTVCLLIILVHGLLQFQLLRELRSEVRELSEVLTKVLLRFEDWLDEQRK